MSTRAILKRWVATSWLVLLLAASALLACAALASGRGPSAATSRVTAPTWTVISQADSGPGSLRQAMVDAGDGDTILFSPAAFPPASPVTITVSNALPAITQTDLTIDASNAGVILDGAAVGGVIPPGLIILADGVTIRGLQIANFAGCGIELRAQGATIGGDRTVGSSPTGEANLLRGNWHSGICIFDGGANNVVDGNLLGVDRTGSSPLGDQGTGVSISGGHHNLIENNIISSQHGAGIAICCSSQSAYNIVRTNLIGVAVDGITPLEILHKGVVVSDGANHNTIGPGNVISQGSGGILIGGTLSPGNTILDNSIFGNEESGIWLGGDNLHRVPAPDIAAFDLAAGSVSGAACSSCLVQIYSDEAAEGRTFEGQAFADSGGSFSFENGDSLLGPHLAATATDPAGTTSAFSIPTAGPSSFPIQSGNNSRVFSLAILDAYRLSNNKIGFHVQDQGWVDSGMANATVINHMGVKRVRGAMNDPDQYSINWNTDELAIQSSFDEMITNLKQRGIQMTYILVFWDKEQYRDSGSVEVPRFQTEEEIQSYLDFVSLMVGTFGDRVDYYELWNEPSWHPACLEPTMVQCIPLDTYIDLAKRAIPLIREVDPGAKIVVPSYHGWDPPELYQEYLYEILQSELMPMVDVIAWHPFIVNLDLPECGGDWFDEYWGTVFPEIRALAVANGFNGEFQVDELVFPSSSEPSTDPCRVSERTAIKYLVRELLHHLGEDVAAGFHGTGIPRVHVMSRLATLMAGAQAERWPVVIEPPTNVLTYTYALPGDDEMVALWNDTAIGEEDATITVTLSLPGSPEDIVYGVDPVLGYRQRLEVEYDGDVLVIHDLLVREYPLLVQRVSPKRVYLPFVRK